MAVRCQNQDSYRDKKKYLSGIDCNDYVLHTRCAAVRWGDVRLLLRSSSAEFQPGQAGCWTMEPR